MKELIPDIIAIIAILIVFVAIYVAKIGNKKAQNVTANERLYEIDKWLSGGVILSREYADNLKAHIEKVAKMPDVDEKYLRAIRIKFQYVFRDLYDKSLKKVPLYKDYSDLDEFDREFVNSCNN